MLISIGQKRPAQNYSSATQPKSFESDRRLIHKVGKLFTYKLKINKNTCLVKNK